MRASGILMPVFSLPGPFGIGTLGKEAFAFVDFLADAKQTYWQILPIGPTGYGDSPYQSFSAFAGNPYFIDYRLLADVGLLTADEVPAARPVGPIDYGALYNERPVILKKAADRLLAAPSPSYEAFCEAQSFWLEDYALFMAVKAEQGQAGLSDWPDALRCRQPEELTEAMICACLASVSDTAVIPLADWLHLGSEARINTPSTQGSNWQWRLTCPLPEALAGHIAQLTVLYERAQ